MRNEFERVRQGGDGEVGMVDLKVLIRASQCGPQSSSIRVALELARKANFSDLIQDLSNPGLWGWGPTEGGESLV